MLMVIQLIIYSLVVDFDFVFAASAQYWLYEAPMVWIGHGGLSVAPGPEAWYRSWHVI